VLEKGHVAPWSPLTQGRGLKHEHPQNTEPMSPSPLTQGRGLKHQYK
jgi:hypothetical protein